MCKGKPYLLAGLLSCLVFMLIEWGEQVQSQEKYPTREIEIICTVTAGGAGDITTRLAAAFFNKRWGVPVNVVNKPGGNSIPGCLEVFRAAPNGYTMLTDSIATTSLLGAFTKDLPFNIMDRSFIGIHSTSPFLICVPSTSPYKTLEDLIAEAKKNPEKISYTSMGGLGVEYTIRQFFNAIGADISKARPVMTRGGSEAVIMTAGGHAALGSATVLSFLPAIKGGTVRPLFLAHKERYPDLPDVPSSAEVGLPKVIFGSWVGISGPPKLPSHIVEKWSKAFEEMVKDPEFISQLKKAGSIPFYYDAQGHKDFAKKEMEEASRLFSK